MNWKAYIRSQYTKLISNYKWVVDCYHLKKTVKLGEVTIYYQKLYIFFTFKHRINCFRDSFKSFDLYITRSQLSQTHF